MKTLSLLFLSSGSACHSQMAEAIARQQIRKSTLVQQLDIQVYSACVKAKGDHSKAISVMAENGIDMKPATSYVLAPDLYGQLDWFINLSHTGDDACFPGLSGRVNTKHWVLDDSSIVESRDKPTKNDYRRIRDQLVDRISDLVRELETSQNLLIKRAEFTRNDYEIVHQETRYKGFFELQELTLKHALFEGGVSPEIKRELFVRGPVVVVLLYDPRKDMVVVIEQFRVGCLEDERSPWLIELVAGIIDEGETPEQVAHRETLEEAGCSIQQLELVYKYWVSPGGNDEQVYLFCACIDSDGVGGIHGVEHEHEDIRVHLIPEYVAWQAVESGIINNAATIMGLQWLQLNKASLRQRWC